MRERYRRMKGWNGTVYYIRMTEAEITARRHEAAFWITLAGTVAFLTGIFLAMVV